MVGVSPSRTCLRLKKPVAHKVQPKEERKLHTSRRLVVLVALRPFAIMAPVVVLAARGDKHRHNPYLLPVVRPVPVRSVVTRAFFVQRATRLVVVRLLIVALVVVERAAVVLL